MFYLNKRLACKVKLTCDKYGDFYIVVVMGGGNHSYDRSDNQGTHRVISIDPRVRARHTNYSPDTVSKQWLIVIGLRQTVSSFIVNCLIRFAF